MQSFRRHCRLLTGREHSLEFEVEKSETHKLFSLPPIFCETADRQHGSWRRRQNTHFRTSQYVKAEFGIPFLNLCQMQSLVLFNLFISSDRVLQTKRIEKGSVFVSLKQRRVAECLSN